MSFETRYLNPQEPSQNNDNSLPKGAILQNRYEILNVLGMGGMGAVYLAQDLRFTGVTRKCAIKEMISATPDPHLRRLAVQNFEREANLLVQLNHPGIPKIYDFFTESMRSYLAMEYVEGGDLEQTLESTEGMLAEDMVLNWAVQVCDVLVYLHNQEPAIVFRDLKPAYIMLRGDSYNIALIVFGIAKAFEVGQKGTMIGTEGYSPPEQYRGIADPRGDIYALGATLHHLLTKRDPRLEAPFTFHEEPPRLLNPALSEETNSVIIRALQYEPEKRYPSAQMFKDALQAALNRSGSSAAAPMETQMLQQGPQPTAPLSPGATPPPQQAAPPPPQQGYPPQQQPYPPQPQYPPQYYQQHPQQPYPPQPYPGQPGYPPPYPPQQGYPPMPGMTGELEQEAEDSILPIWKFKCEDEIRGKAAVADKNNLYIGAYDNNVYALDLKSGDFQWKYPTDGGIAVKPFLYNDRLFFGSEDQVMYAITDKGRLAWTCPTQGRVRSSAAVEFDHVFFGSDDHKLYAANAQTGRVIWQYETLGPVRSSPAIGEELVYVGSEDGHLHAVDLSSGAARWKFKANRNITSSPALFKDVIIVGSFDWNVYCVDAKSGYDLWRVRTGNAVISSPTIADGTVYIGSTDKNLYAIDLNTGRVQWKYNAESQIVSTPAVSAEAVYFGTSAGEVISIGRKDKRLRWKFKTGGPVTSSPLVADGIVYIGSTDHHVYALPA
ncbi:MAG: serine/threonine-protein kinase [Chloroflexota bacterium]